MYKHKDGIEFKKLNKDNLSQLLALKDYSWITTHNTPVLNEDDQTAWYERMQNSDRDLILAGYYRGEFGGIVTFNNINWISRSVDIGGHIFKGFTKDAKIGWAAGVDFAFEILNMNRLSGEILEIHRPSLMLTTNYLGFKIEGTKRQTVYKCGKYLNSIVVGLLRSEWQESERVKAYKGSCCENISFDLFDRLIKRARQHV